MAGHECAQQQKIAELEKRMFPLSMDPFTYLLEDAVFKRETARALEKQAAEHEIVVREVRELRERSDGRDKEIEEAILKKFDECPVKGRFESFHKDEFTPLKEGIIERKWIHDIVKPVILAVLTFVAMELLKGVVGL